MLGAARTLHATLFLVVLCVTATQRIQHADFADVEATGLAPRRTGRCWVDGPCERYPDSGGRRDDNQQGYLLYSAGVSPELCALRARDHHRWCGNHPDAVVLTHFERETPLAPAVDVSDAAFPYIGLHSDAAAAAGSGEEGALQCVESYQIGEGSRGKLPDREGLAWCVNVRSVRRTRTKGCLRAFEAWTRDDEPEPPNDLNSTQGMRQHQGKGQSPAEYSA